MTIKIKEEHGQDIYDSQEELVCADAYTILLAVVAITVDEPFHHSLLKASAQIIIFI